MAVTADGRRAVSASDDSTLKVWDLETSRDYKHCSGRCKTFFPLQRRASTLLPATGLGNVHCLRYCDPRDESARPAL